MLLLVKISKNLIEFNFCKFWLEKDTNDFCRNAICKVKMTTATATRRNLKKGAIAATAMRRDGSKNYSSLPRRCRSVMLKTINAASTPPPQRERRGSGGGSAAMNISATN